MQPARSPRTRIQLDRAGRRRTTSTALRQLVRPGYVGLWRRGAVANVARSSIAFSGLANMYLKEAANALQLPWLQRTPALRDAACALDSGVVVMIINPVATQSPLSRARAGLNLKTQRHLQRASPDCALSSERLFSPDSSRCDRCLPSLSSI